MNIFLLFYNMEKEDAWDYRKIIFVILVLFFIILFYIYLFKPLFLFRIFYPIQH